MSVARARALTHFWLSLSLWSLTVEMSVARARALTQDSFYRIHRLYCVEMSVARARALTLNIVISSLYFNV